MSKCRGSGTGGGAALVQRGLLIHNVHEESAEGTKRFVVLKIPYEALLSDPEFQHAFQDIVRITTAAEEQQ
jgi:hypothetical protein